MSDTKREPRRPGRPLKGEKPALPVDELDRVLVHGEVGPDGTLVYPSYRDLGARYGVAHSLIAAYSRQHNCLGRRAEATAKLRARTSEKLTEKRAESLATEQDDLLRTLDRFFRAFEQALDEGRVRCDSPSDFNLMCRLRAFLLGDADSRSEVVDGISLEDLQKRHRAMLDELAAKKDDDDDDDKGNLH